MISGVGWPTLQRSLRLLVLLSCSMHARQPEVGLYSHTWHHWNLMFHRVRAACTSTWGRLSYIYTSAGSCTRTWGKIRVTITVSVVFMVRWSLIEDALSLCVRKKIQALRQLVCGGGQQKPFKLCGGMVQPRYTHLELDSTFPVELEIKERIRNYGSNSHVRSGLRIKY